MRRGLEVILEAREVEVILEARLPHEDLKPLVSECCSPDSMCLLVSPAAQEQGTSAGQNCDRCSPVNSLKFTASCNRIGQKKYETKHSETPC